MSQLSTARSETPSGSPHRLSSQDSPTIPDRVAVIANPQVPRSSIRKPAPSPLHASTAVSPPSSASPSRSQFPSSIHHEHNDPAFGNRFLGEPFRDPFPLSPPADDFCSLGATQQHQKGGLPSPVSPLSANKPSNPGVTSLPPNVSKLTVDSVVTTKPLAGIPASASLPSMAGAGQAAAARADPSAAPRNSSIDSAISAMSSKAHSHQGSQDTSAGSADIANLVKAAGSPEAVIQYLLKEKQSQSQQNQQLWRLVDKQRAMILGLNKDLERSLKEKEKYRKKLKDVMAAHESNVPAKVSLPRLDISHPGDLKADVPDSPSFPDGDSAKDSPTDVSMAPYPITPPSDVTHNGSPSKIGELLDPSHAMPKPSEHALDNYDHEEEGRAAEEARKQPQTSDLAYNASLPPSRGLPSNPPRMPPPRPPPTGQEATNSAPVLAADVESAQLSPSSVSRKAPPAPLQLRPFVTPDEDNDSESDYEELLEVDQLPIPEGRGRRRTREEDDRMREIILMKEAEARSQSKKSSKKGSQKGTPVTEESDMANVEMPTTMPPPPPVAGVQQPMAGRDMVPASLAGVLSGNGSQQLQPQHLNAPLMSPGLPSSPRPMTAAGQPPIHSPPLSPRGLPMTGGPLSPRAPRQPIPLPPNTPLYTPHPSDIINMNTAPRSPVSPRGPPAGPPPTAPLPVPGNPAERTTVYRGFVTEEYPDLLLPPNALPSIEVKVSSSRMKPPRASILSLTQLEEDPVFTLAVISRSVGGELWGVEKDLASLSKLDQRMKQCPAFTAKTPDRSLFTGHSPVKLDSRRVALDQYFDELLNTPLDHSTALELCRYLSTNILRPNIDDSNPAVDPTNGEAVSAPKRGPGGLPLKSGYLTKRGRSFGGWKARFFVLEGPVLKYYEAPGRDHLGNIKLHNALIGKQTQQSHENEEQDKQYRHAFVVKELKKNAPEPKKKGAKSKEKDPETNKASPYVNHVLCAESDQERDQWVDALQRWIDHLHLTEEEPQSERHSNKKSRSNHKSSKPHAPAQSDDSSQDGLIGVSYDSAKTGDAPDGAPRRRGTGSPETPVQEKMSNSAGAPSSFTISGPKDPQLISDAAAWGGKQVLAPPGPSVEEKKQRKRSFFGFGPKVRNDDQDSLYGSSGGNTPQPSSTNDLPHRSGPVRQAFGAPLAEAVRYNPPSDVNVPLPAVVYRCIQYLDEKQAVTEEGIFRLSGSNLVIKALRERFNTEGDVNLMTDETYYDIHAVASLLKLYLRELPTTILTHELHNQFVTVTEMMNHQEKLRALSELVVRLPQANATLLKYLIAFLIKIINNADRNKMTVRNVGIVFSPTLNIPAPVFALLLQNYEPVFGISPEEYELPSPVRDSASGEFPRPPTADLFGQQPRRPSTAASSSTNNEPPQRQRLMEQIRQHPYHSHQPHGSSPTPPPMGGVPRHPQQIAQQFAQQGPTSHYMQPPSRPAYESGLTAPPNFDAVMMQQQQQHQSAGYDQQPVPDERFTARAKRRESNMFMMGGSMNPLNHQSSLNRLRE